jgi:hypothetical protein
MFQKFQSSFLKSIDNFSWPILTNKNYGGTNKAMSNFINIQESVKHLTNTSLKLYCLLLSLK